MKKFRKSRTFSKKKLKIFCFNYIFCNLCNLYNYAISYCNQRYIDNIKVTTVRFTLYIQFSKSYAFIGY